MPKAGVDRLLRDKKLPSRVPCTHPARLSSTHSGQRQAEINPCGHPAASHSITVDDDAPVDMACAHQRQEIHHRLVRGRVIALEEARGCER